MEIKNINVVYDINRNHQPNLVSVTHVNDVNSRIIELELTQGKDALEVGQSCTATASIVERKNNSLINDNVPCSLSKSENIEALLSQVQDAVK